MVLLKGTVIEPEEKQTSNLTNQLQDVNKDMAKESSTEEAEMESMEESDVE